MKIGIDGIPLSAAKTGVGHYTFEVARALAVAQPQEEFQVVSQIPFVAAAIKAMYQHQAILPSSINL